MNLTVNLLGEERAFLGRLAADQDKPVGQLVRDLISTALCRAYPADVAAMREARRRRRSVLMAAVGIWAALFGGWPDSGIDLRRAPKTASVRTVRRVEDFA